MIKRRYKKIETAIKLSVLVIAATFVGLLSEDVTAREKFEPDTSRPDWTKPYGTPINHLVANANNENFSGELHLTQEDSIYSAAGLAVRPEYPGGLDAFYGEIAKKFKIPKVTPIGQVKVYVSFVVEKDGSMSHVKIMRDPGY